MNYEKQFAWVLGGSCVMSVIPCYLLGNFCQ